MPGILSLERKTAIRLASIQQNPRSVKLFLDHHPEAVPLAAQMHRAIENKQINTAGLDPYEAMQRAFNFITRRQANPSKPRDRIAAALKLK